MTTAVKGTYQMIKLTSLIPSSNNSRKTHDKDRDQSLAKSIEALGVIVPLIVRPAEAGKGCYDVVAGHRRLKAAAAAELTEVPCIVKDLDDNAVEVERVTENAERDEIPPIDEAHAIARLVKQLGGDVKEAAQRLGKTASAVAMRLDLLKLAPKVQEAIKEGTLLLTWANEFRRVADHAAQEKLLGDVLQGGWSAPKSIEALRKLVESKYSLDLSRAIFDTEDAELCPKAGSCLACPKRTGGQVEFFDDLGKKAPDICRDRICFEEKVKAHTAALVEAGKAGSVKVLTGGAADKAIAAAEKGWGDTKFKSLDAKAASGQSGHQLVKSIGETALQQVVTAVGRDGRAVKLYPAKALDDIFDKANKAKAASGPKKKKPDAEKKQEQAYEREKQRRKAQQHLEETIQVVIAEKLAELMVAKSWIKQPLLQAVANSSLDNLMDPGDEHLAASLGLPDSKMKNYTGMRKINEDAANDPKKAFKVIAYTLAFQSGPLPAFKKLMATLGVDWSKAEAEAKSRIVREEDIKSLAGVRPDEREMAEKVFVKKHGADALPKAVKKGGK